MYVYKALQKDLSDDIGMQFCLEKVQLSNLLKIN